MTDMSDLQLSRAQRPRRILFVGAAADPRTGGERYSAAVIDALRRRGWTVEIVTPDDLPATAKTSFIGANRWLIRRHGHDAKDLLIVEDFYWHPRTFIFNAVMRVRGARLVCIVHHLYHDLRPRRWQRWADWVLSILSLMPVHRVIVNSTSTAGGVLELGVPRRRLILIPPGVEAIPDEPAPRTGSTQTGRRLLVVGNVDRRKGLEHLVRAMALLEDASRLEVVGQPDRDPGYRSELAELIENLHLKERVTFRGRLDDAELVDAYRAADVVVVPSLWEGFGIALLEAMLHGLPIVATSVGAIPELIRDGETGLLVPPADPVALAGALERLRTDPVLAMRIGSGARRHALQVARTWGDMGDAVAAAVEALRKN